MAIETKELPIRGIKVYVKIRIRLKDKRMSFEFPKEVSNFGEAGFFWGSLKQNAEFRLLISEFRVCFLSKTQAKRPSFDFPEKVSTFDEASFSKEASSKTPSFDFLPH